jgi:hypothetical protein
MSCQTAVAHHIDLDSLELVVLSINLPVIDYHTFRRWELCYTFTSTTNIFITTR